MSEKRQRSQNYTVDNVLQVIQLVQDFKTTIENKKTDAVSCTEKNKAWEKICFAYNAQTLSQRSPEQLRQKYDTLKKETRKYYAQLRQQRLQTGGGGGPPHVENKFEIIYSKIRELIKLSTEGHKSYFDCDSSFLESSTANGDVIEIELVDNCQDENTHLDTCGASVPLAMETHTTDTTWKRSPLQVLRRHLNCSLDVNCSPELQTADRNLQLVDNEAYNTDGAVTPRESLPSTQVSANQPSASRHKPSRRQKLPLSATARHLAPWVSAKTQLIELQMQLIQKQQEREHAAEKREQQLFKLKKESLELKIEIRKEKLKKNYFWIKPVFEMHLCCFNFLKKF